MKRLSALLSFLPLVSLAVAAEPMRVGDPHSPAWVAASEVLYRDGSFKEPWGLSDAIREQVQKQSMAFALRTAGLHEDLEEGARPPRDLCAGVPPLNPDAPSMRSKIFYDPRIDHFDLTVLTSRVAVLATVSDLITGFRANGDPGLLLELSEVVPLHHRSALPAYALIPTDQVVIHGRVFCADELRREYAFQRPEVGDRVVLIGSLWVPESVVRPWFYYEGRFSVVRGTKAGESALDWATGYEEDTAFGIGNTPVPSVPADTLLGLHEYMDELQASGLFEWVDSRLSDPHGDSEAREQFFKAWKSARDAGCRPRATRDENTDVWQLDCDSRTIEASLFAPPDAVDGEVAVP